MNNLYGIENSSNTDPNLTDRSQVTLDKNRSRVKMILNVIIIIVMAYHIKNLVEMNDIFATIVDVCRSLSACMTFVLIFSFLTFRGYKLNTFDKILYAALIILCLFTIWMITDKWSEVVSQGIKSMTLRISDI